MFPHRRVGPVGSNRWRAGLAAVILWGVVTGRARAQEPAYRSLRINEVIANNNSVKPTNCLCEHVDMVEIYNPTAEQVKLHDVPPGGSPRAFKLTDGTTVWEFEATHKINPSGRFVVFCDSATECRSLEGCPESGLDSRGEAHATFALDRDGETVALLDPDGEVIDLVTFPPLAADVSYGRFPDGADSFVFSQRTTEANDATSFGTCQRPPLLPGIVCPGSRNTAGSNVDPGIDLIDYQTNSPVSGEPVALLARVKDEKLPDRADIAQIDIVYRLDGGPEQRSPMAFLGMETDELNLLDQWSIWRGEIPGQIDGTVVDFHLLVKDREGASGTSPETLCVWPAGPCPVVKLPECPRECQVPYRYLVGPKRASPLVLNEVVPENQTLLEDPSELLECLDRTERCHHDDFLEVYNASDEEQPLAGLVLTNKAFRPDEGWVFPPGSAIQPRQRLIVWVDGDGQVEPGSVNPNDPSIQAFHTDFTVDGRRDEVYLFTPLGTPPGQRRLHAPLDGLRWGRPEEPIIERDSFVSPGSGWKLWKGAGGDPPEVPDPPAGPGSAPLIPWTHPRYPDETWISGSCPLGYGASGLATVLSDMRGSYLTVLARRRFTVPDSLFREEAQAYVTTVKRLFLEVTYDDGFRAYLNGEPAAARNLRGTGVSVAARGEIAPAREVLDLTGIKDQLRKGEAANVLSVEVHNASLASEDLVLGLRLFWGIEGLGNDDSLSRIPDGRPDARAIKVPPDHATPGAVNRSPFRLFRRGDSGSPPNGEVDISDAIGILGFLFLGTNTPSCMDAADVDNSGGIDIGDPINLLNFLFLGGTAPASPGSQVCGPDVGLEDALEECADPLCN